MKNKRIWFPVFYLFLSFQISYASELQVITFDADEGLSILLKNGRKGILIDTGPVSKTAQILRKIKKYRIKKLDYLILTHLHSDHASGYFRILESFPKIPVLENCHADSMDLKSSDTLAPIERWVAVSLQKNKNRKCIKRGDQIKWGDVMLDVLSPDKIDSGNLNRHSLVLGVRQGSFYALVMGDADKIVEKELLDKDLLPASVDLLVVGHHGAEDTGDVHFLEKIKPKLAVVPVNQDNVWGRPASETLKNLKQYSERVLITGKEGDICRQPSGFCPKTR